MDAVGVVLRYGVEDEVSDIFNVAEHHGGGVRNELICMSGLFLAGLFCLAKPYAAGRYMLTPKGLARKGHTSNVDLPGNPGRLTREGLAATNEPAPQRRESEH
jgi:hypothetical protein